MPVSNFADTSESSVFFKKVGPCAGGALAGGLIGVGIGLPAVEAEDVIRESSQSIACNIGISKECGSYISEEVSDVLEAMPAGLALVALGGLVAVIAGAKPLKNRTDPEN